MLERGSVIDFDWVKFAVGLAISLSSIAVGMAMFERAIRNWTWRCLVVTPAGMVFAAVLAVFVAALSGTPTWSILIAVYLCELWAAIYAVNCALRVRRERLRKRQ
jgi:hypothetical protein